MLFSALRCIVRYVVVPLVLPLLGLTLRLSLGIAIGLDFIALGMLAFSLWRFWRARDPRRWSYLPLAVVLATAIIIFLAYDLVILTA
jgi:hypothetical protein